jgi:hypothetical protein
MQCNKKYVSKLKRASMSYKSQRRKRQLSQRRREKGEGTVRARLGDWLSIERTHWLVGRKRCCAPCSKSGETEGEELERQWPLNG